MVWAYKDLLFEDYPILPWNILIAVLKRFNLRNLLEVEVRSIRDQFNLQLVALCGCVIWRNPLNK